LFLIVAVLIVATMKQPQGFQAVTTVAYEFYFPDSFPTAKTKSSSRAFSFDIYFYFCDHNLL